MYSILHETDASTAVNLSAWGEFLPGAGKQLVTIGTKCLKFYRLNPFYTAPIGEQPSQQRNGFWGRTAKVTESGNKAQMGKRSVRLECILSFTLMAPVRSMAVVRLKAHPHCDSLAMTFDDAKLSIVFVNPCTRQLSTLSLHSIEDDFLREGYTKDTMHMRPELRADPDNRCCTFTVYGRHLAIVPFVRESRENESGVGMLQQSMLLQSYTLKMRSLDERLDNVVDMCFLHGYYEPTLLFLYEPIQTTAGRACVRWDTVAVLGVSLNIKDRTHAVVWNFVGLPSTVDRCLPILAPIGGVCLFGANEIVYLNQSVPARGISLNSCAVEFTRFPLSTHQQHLRISLDGCVVQTLHSSPNDLLVALRTGEIHVLSLDTDQAHMVRELRLTKTEFVSSIPCSLSIHPHHPLVFIGSRLGDSQLLRFSTEQRKRSADGMLNGGELPNGNSALLFDEDDFYLYGREFCNSFQFEESHHSVIGRHYGFAVVDSIANIGPCKWLRTCSPSQISAIFCKKPRDVFFDLATVSGHSKDTSLCFFHRTIRPQIVTTTVLEDALQLFVIGRREDARAHKYLVISRERSTLVLEVSSENQMVELDVPELFCQTEHTVAAGELAQGEVVVQVTPTSVLLVSTGAPEQQLQVLDVDSSFPVISASIVDPFVAFLTLNGRFLLYRLITHPRVQLQQVPILEVLKHEKSPVTALCIYRDQSGITRMCSKDKEGTKDEKAMMPLAVNARMFARTEESGGASVSMELADDALSLCGNDVDAYLYGSQEEKLSSTRGRRLTTGEEEEGEEGTMDSSQQHYALTAEAIPDGKHLSDVEEPDSVMPTYWLFLVRGNGHLYIYSLPEMRLVYMVKKFCLAHELLYGHMETAAKEEEQRPVQQFMSTPVILPQQSESGAKAEGSHIVKPEEVVVELQVCGLGTNGARPVLSALVDDQVIFYEMFPCDDHIKGQLAVRFRRLSCTNVVRENRFLGSNGRAPIEAAREAEERHRQCICPFARIGNVTNGLFVCGGYPSMLVLDRGEPHLHPMSIDGPVGSFAPFNNSSNCLNGFLYLTKRDQQMRIATLCPEMDYDASCPRRKVPIGQTIHHCVFLLQQGGVFALTMSEARPNQKQCSVVNEDKQMETHERDSNFILPQLDFYTLKLFSAEDWRFVPGSEFAFDEFEVVTCCEEVLLNSESTMSGVQNYLAVGTAQNYGEEVYVRGRVILFELVEVVPEENQPTTRHRLKTVYDKEQKGPVTSLCAVNGFLLTGMGQKVFIWQFRDGQLHGVSFLDLHSYVHHMVAFRELVLVCDLYRSLSLIRYQEEFKALSLVSRDLRPTAPSPMSAHFLVDQKQLGFLLTDEFANITLFNYLPETKESIGGERLIIRAALNIGSLVNTLVRVQGHQGECFLLDGEHHKGTHTCLFATLDGSMGFVRPLTEKVFRRLHMLQQVMNLHVPQPAGLNPRGGRAAHPQRTGTNQQISAAKNIVDGLLVLQYLHLSVQEKTDLARKLGTSRYQIMDDLTELLRTVTHF